MAGATGVGSPMVTSPKCWDLCVLWHTVVSSRWVGLIYQCSFLNWYMYFCWFYLQHMSCCYIYIVIY